MRKVGMRKALEFFEENYLMISSLEIKSEKGCADKCLEMLRKAVANQEKEVKENDKMP